MRAVVGTVMEVTVGLALGYAYISLSRFLHTLGPRQEGSLMWVKVLPPAVLALVGWWLWVRVRHDPNTAGWRKVAGVLGLIAASLAVSVPWIVVYYDVIVTGFDMRHQYPRSKFPGWTVIDLYWTFQSCFFISAVAMVLGLVAPRRIRLVVVVGGFATYWLMDTLAVR